MTVYNRFIVFAQLMLLLVSSISSHSPFLDAVGVTSSQVQVDEERLLAQAARRESLRQRARNLRAVATDLVESARLLAGRTDALSHRTELLREEHAVENEVLSNEAEVEAVFLRLRKNKAPKLKGSCDVGTCHSVCISDCNYLCGNTLFIRPSECDVHQFCQSRCDTGCQLDACEFRFNYNFKPTNSVALI